MFSVVFDLLSACCLCPPHFHNYDSLNACCIMASNWAKKVRKEAAGSSNEYCVLSSLTFARLGTSYF
jgi:hypothetical protein